MVYLDDIELRQDYLRQAGEAGFALSIISLILTGFALYASYLQRVNRQDEAPNWLKFLGWQYTPAILHGLASLFCMAGFATYVNVVNSQIQNDPALDPRVVVDQLGGSAGWGPGVNLLATSFVFEFGAFVAARLAPLVVWSVTHHHSLGYMSECHSQCVHCWRRNVLPSRTV